MIELRTGTEQNMRLRPNRCCYMNHAGVIPYAGITKMKGGRTAKDRCVRHTQDIQPDTFTYVFCQVRLSTPPDKQDATPVFHQPASEFGEAVRPPLLVRLGGADGKGIQRTG